MVIISRNKIYSVGSLWVRFGVCKYILRKSYDCDSWLCAAQNSTASKHFLISSTYMEKQFWEGAHFTEYFFNHNSNVMEISFFCHSDFNTTIATQFCTWHDSCGAMACAKFCCDNTSSNWITAKLIFHGIWIVMEKPLVKWIPGPVLLNDFPLVIQIR